MGHLQETTTTPPFTVGVVFVRGILSGLRARHIDCDEWPRGANIEPELLLDDRARFTLQQIATLLRLLIEKRDDEGLGMFSRPLTVGSFALQVRGAIGVSSLEVAIRRMAHVFKLRPLSEMRGNAIPWTRLTEHAGLPPGRATR